MLSLVIGQTVLILAFCGLSIALAAKYDLAQDDFLNDLAYAVLIIISNFFLIYFAFDAV